MSQQSSGSSRIGSVVAHFTTRPLLQLETREELTTRHSGSEPHAQRSQPYGDGVEELGDGHLRHVSELEVVVEGRHAEHPAALAVHPLRVLEVRHLRKCSRAAQG
eukprot:9496688-Pyramimonas_sp.AAC.1